MSRAVILTLVCVLCTAGATPAFTGGSPIGKTGAPGEDTCADCHDNLNTGSGGIDITAPTEYAPGETLDIFVQVHHVGQEKWGFQITVLDDANQPVGDLILTEPSRTQFQLDGGNGRQYITHTGDGTDTGVFDVSPGWSLKWASPGGVRVPVTFYAAGDAADDAGGTNGDYIYTGAANLTESLVLEDGISWSIIKMLFW